MHMADALLSPSVATTMALVSTATAGYSIKKLREEEIKLQEPLNKKLPTMAVMSALVFAGQMINYTIPGTGSSGHLCGGFLLSAILGPYAGFLSMIVILAIQCLFFADGGLMALGANCFNMAFFGCFLGYFLIYKPLINKSNETSIKRNLIIASILGCVLTLQLGALSVVVETSLSKITELPFIPFVILMSPIHLAIGLVEGLITSAVLVFIYEARPELLREINNNSTKEAKFTFAKTISILSIIVLLVGGGLSLYASSNPDGLEWSLFGNAESGYSENMGLDEEEFGISSSMSQSAQNIQDKTAFLPDYTFSSNPDSPVGTSVSGIVGSLIVALCAIITCAVGGYFSKKAVR